MGGGGESKGKIIEHNSIRTQVSTATLLEGEGDETLRTSTRYPHNEQYCVMGGHGREGKPVHMVLDQKGQVASRQFQEHLANQLCDHMMQL